MTDAPSLDDAALPRMQAAAAAPPRAPLALLDVLDREGHVRRSVPVHGFPVTFGRAIDNDIVLDDPHVAPHHARLELAPDGRLRVCALPSLNGVSLGRRRLLGGEQSEAPTGETWHFGVTGLRLRLADEVLAPERVLPRAGLAKQTWALAALLFAWTVAEYGVRLDPGAKLTDWIQPVLGLPAVLLLWCSLWGLGSKLFQHRFDLKSHFAIAVRGLLAIQAAELFLPAFASSTSWEWLSRIAPGAAALCAVALLWAHASLLLPTLRRRLGIAALSAFVAGAAILLTINHQRSDRWFGELYMSALLPPVLRIARPVSVDVFLREAMPLEARLDGHVADAEAEDEEEPVDD